MNWFLKISKLYLSMTATQFLFDGLFARMWGCEVMTGQGTTMVTIKNRSAFDFTFLLGFDFSRIARDDDHMMARKRIIDHYIADDAFVDLLSTRKTKFVTAFQHFQRFCRTLEASQLNFIFGN